MRSIFDFHSLKEIHDYFKSVQDKVRVETGGIFDECDDCKHRSRQLCMGGCLAHFVSHHLDGNEEAEQVPMFQENRNHG